jgi:hypothetical protein
MPPAARGHDECFCIMEIIVSIYRGLVEIFSFSKGFRLYKLLLKCESLLLLTPTFLLLLNKPTISEAYKSTGLTVFCLNTNNISSSNLL